MSQTACPNCGNLAASPTKFCAHCGSPMPPATSTRPGVDEGLGGAAPPPPAIEVEASDPGRSRSRWPLVAVGLLVVASLGALGWFFLIGQSDGASDPESAVFEFAEAINSDDPYTIVRAVAPSEVDGIADLLTTLSDRLSESGLDTWESDGTGFDIRIDLTSAVVADEAEDAALVEVDGTMLVDGISWPGPIGALLGDSYELDLDDAARALDDRGVRELTVGVVREDGGWYVSPLLTSANIGAGLLDLPGPDLDAVSDQVDRTARDGEEAIEQALEAAIDIEVDDLVPVIDPSLGRILLAFEDAFDELRRNADDEGYSTTGFRLDVRDLDDGKYGLDEMSVMASTFDDAAEILVSDDCVEVDFDDRSCIFDSFPGDLQHEQVVLATSEIDGGYVVDPIASVIAFADDLINAVDPTDVLDLFDIEVYDTPIQVGIGTETEVDFAGRAYAVLETTPDAGDAVLGSAYGEIDGVRTYTRQDDDTWVSSRFTVANGEPVRVVVWAPIRSCGPAFCERDVDERVDAVLHRAVRQEIDGPNQYVAGDLERGDGYVFEFDVSEATPTTYVVDEGAVDVHISRDGEPPRRAAEVSELVPGRYELYVWNTGDEPTSFRVSPTAVSEVDDRRDVGFSDDVDIGVSGWFDVFEFAPGSNVVVTAQGLGGEDIVLQVSSDADSGCNYVDSQVFEPERCVVEVGASGLIEVRVQPYSAAANHAVVRLEVG